MTIPNNLFHQITSLLLPLMITVDDRELWLTQAFYYTDPRLYYKFEREGAPIHFVTHCIRTAMDFGCFVDGVHPLAVLLDAIRAGC